MTVQEMIETHPEPGRVDRDALVDCIERCFSCAAVCTSCADVCLAEERVRELDRCIRLSLDCADICVAIGRVLTRQTSVDRALLRSALTACADACGICADECELHEDEHEQCRVCAEECRRCEQSCSDLLVTVNGRA
jgi:hypothetical protein